MRRRWLAIGLLLTLLLVGVAWFVLYQRNRPIQVAKSDLVRVELVPIPEGPPGPLFEREPTDPYALPMTLIEDLIPQPLPAPLWQGLGCEFGGNLVIDLADGDTITYGPCRRPPEIHRLWDQVVAVWRQAQSD